VVKDLTEAGAPPSELRYERKFLVEAIDAHQAQLLIRLHPALFTSPYPPRQVNSLYLDDPDLSDYYDNVRGAAERKKVRLRWYGGTFGVMAHPALEIKFKRGLVGGKLRCPLVAPGELAAVDNQMAPGNPARPGSPVAPDNLVAPDNPVRAGKMARSTNLAAPVNLAGGFGDAQLQQMFDAADLPLDVRGLLKGLSATLLNSYQRQYFVSSDQRFRLTLDSRLVFYQANQALGNTFMHRQRADSQVILELKYDPQHETLAPRVAGFYPFRATRSSKYVQGMERVYL
jgi:hypothetical protein